MDKFAGANASQSWQRRRQPRNGHGHNLVHLHGCWRANSAKCFYTPTPLSSLRTCCLLVLIILRCVFCAGRSQFCSVRTYRRVDLPAEMLPNAVLGFNYTGQCCGQYVLNVSSDLFFFSKSRLPQSHPDNALTSSRRVAFDWHTGKLCMCVPQKVARKYMNKHVCARATSV